MILFSVLHYAVANAERGYTAWRMRNVLYILFAIVYITQLVFVNMSLKEKINDWTSDSEEEEKGFILS